MQKWNKILTTMGYNKLTIIIRTSSKTDYYFAKIYNKYEHYGILWILCVIHYTSH